MKRKTFIALLLFICLASSQNLFARTIFVPSISLLITTIQDGINFSNNGDTIIVYPGTYYENINYNGKNITIASLYLVTKNINYIDSTIITSGKELGSNGSVVSFENGETVLAKLIGFTIQKGIGNIRSFDSAPIVCGGGIFCSNASPTLSHLIIQNNNSSKMCCGGGIFLHASSAIVENCLIKNHNISSMIHYSPDAGGGIACFNCPNLIIRNSIFTKNTASTGGGAIYLYKSTVSIINCLITNNTSARGSAIYADSQSNICVTNCSACNNSAIEGLIYFINEITAYINNSIFWNNISTSIVFQSIFSPNAIVVSHSNLEGGIESILTNNNGKVQWLYGNINTCPMFVNENSNNFHLQNLSPCIDAGDTISVLNITENDLDGNNRFVGIIDMGCYENPPSMGYDNISANETHSTNSSIVNIFPNPFASEFTVSGTNSGGKIDFYNSNGANIFSSKTESNSTNVNLGNFNLKPGVYMLKYTENGKTISKKIIKS